MIRSSEPARIQDIRVLFKKFFRTQILKPKFWTCQGNSVCMVTLVYCVNYRDKHRYCFRRSIGKEAMPPKNF